MADKLKGRKRHLVDGDVEQVKKAEKVETIREFKQRQGILSKLIGFLKGKKEDE